MLTAGAILRRSAAYMKLRQYKEALQDADAAIEADGSFAKGYLRRAAANEALENFEDAVRDYEKVCHPEPCCLTLCPCDHQPRCHMLHDTHLHVVFVPR